MKILIVEDEEQIRSLLGRFLGGIGHQTSIAENGREAWEVLIAPDHQIDVVLADIKMPEMDGRELIRRMKEKGIQTPVMFISGQINVTHQDAVEAGAIGIIHKPFELSSIMEVLQDLDLQPEGG